MHAERPRRNARRRRRVAVWILAAGAVTSSGCRTATREEPGVEPRSASSSVDAPCTAVVRKVDVSSWREVQMPAFVVCLPRDWKQSSSMWRRGASTIRWGIGIYPDPESRQPVPGTVLSGGTVNRQEGEAAGTVVRRFGEMIGGSWADLWRSRRGGNYRSGVQWVEARLWFTSEATDAQTADLQLNIYRTVRFVAR